MIEARIRKRFPPGRESAEFSLDLEFRAAFGVTVLFGPSGSGKTLTLDSIAGFVRPDDGRILLDGRILFDGPARVCLTPQERRCGYVFQNYALFPNMTLRKNLEFAAEARPRLERHRRVNEMLERFRLAEVAGRRPHEVSGGQKQRCSIARALIGAPLALLLDEPARGLDAPLRSELYAILREIRSEFEVPILLVTHDLDECFELGDHMLVVGGGRVAQSGPPREIVRQPANLDVARLLGVYNLLEAEVLGLDPGRNSSRLRVCDSEIQGPYLPGRLLGDRVHLCVMPSRLRAARRAGRPGPREIPARLSRAVEQPSNVRLEFDNGLAVDAAPLDPQALKPGEDWVIEIPPEAVRAV